MEEFLIRYYGLAGIVIVAQAVWIGLLWRRLNKKTDEAETAQKDNLSRYERREDKHDSQYQTLVKDVSSKLEVLIIQIMVKGGNNEQ